ncbi:unnamed protein product [Blepharisma stoltei]|uniref:non-specific serine/threonine protein kinase n=1 Tax=Blepharisma stoltei TaxID=1481888 RepID=A0AAU9JBZ0_9CILI|nr:unnamed protein product [Blepharisma stoltei]
MGGKNSCQSTWCTKKAEYLCNCKNIKICEDCKDNKHYGEQHEVEELNSQPKTHNPDAPISTSSLVFTRNIYRSPEGSTEVFEGRVVHRPDKVAIKVMYCRNEGELRKKQQEAKLQKSMVHPNICSCLGYFIDENYGPGFKFLIVMEFSEKGDLEQDIEYRKIRNDYWPENQLLTHWTEIIDAFAYLQEMNMTHGDVKPRNLFLANNGKLKLGDFGESRQGMQALVTKTYQVTGTVMYFSPKLFKEYLEIIKGNNVRGDVRHNPIKSDVFSLGLTFLHMASLAKPTDLNNLEVGIDNLQKQVERAIAKLSYSDKVKILLAHMLAVQENKRWDFKQLKHHLSQGDLEHDLNEVSKQNEETDAKPAAKSVPKIEGHFAISLAQVPGRAYICEIDNRKIRKTSSLNSHRFQSSSRVAVIDEGVVVTGGLKNSKNVFLINLVTRDSAKLEDMKQGRAWHAITVLNKDLFVIGGRDPERKEPIKSVEIYKDGKWDECEPLNIERENATALAVDNEIYVVGGANKSTKRLELISSIEKYFEGHWEVLSLNLPVPMSGVGLVNSAPRTIMIIGGGRERGVSSPETFEWNLDTNQIVLEEKALPEGDTFGSNSYFIDESKNEVIIIGFLLGIFIYSRATKEWEQEGFKS